MSRRLHTGRPGTRALPAGWAAAHRPVVAGTCNGAVALRKPGTTQNWDHALEQNVAAPHPAYWAGAARIQSLAARARQEVVAVDDTETVTSYLIAVDADATAAEGDLVDVIAAGDPSLDGHTLRVVQVVAGTERVERDLLCTLTA